MPYLTTSHEVNFAGPHASGCTAAAGPATERIYSGCYDSCTGLSVAYRNLASWKGWPLEPYRVASIVVLYRSTGESTLNWQHYTHHWVRWRCRHSRALMLVRADWSLTLLCVIQATTRSVDPDISPHIRVVIAISIAFTIYCQLSLKTNSQTKTHRQKRLAWRYGTTLQHWGNTCHYEGNTLPIWISHVKIKTSLHNLFNYLSSITFQN